MVTQKQYYIRFKNSYDEHVAIVRELPVGQVSSHIEPKLHELLNDFEGNEILTKVLIIGEIEKDFLVKLSKGLGCLNLVTELKDLKESLKPIPISFEIDKFTIQAAFYTEKSCIFNYEGLFEGQLGIVAFASAGAIIPQNLALVKEVFAQHAWIWMLKEKEVKVPSFSFRDDSLSCEWANYGDEATVLSNALKRPDFLSKLAVSHTYNAFLTLETLNQLTGKFVKQSEKFNRTQRLSLPVGAGNLSSTKVNWENDPFYQVKNGVQQQLGLLEKRIQDSMERFFLPATGEFWGKIHPSIDTLRELDTTEKAKSNVLRIDDKVQEAFLNLNRRVLSQQFKSVMRLVNDAVNSLEKDMAQTCRQKEIPTISLYVSPLNDKELPLTLDSTVRMERSYEATVQRKGFYEYFMAVRKYQMLFLMLVSLFGIGSFIRRQPQIMITASLILTAFGAYTLRKTVSQERQEQTEKEVERARENLREETKRIANETLQRWRKQLSDYFKTLNTQVIRQIDEAASNYQQRKQAQQEDVKRTFQRISQNLDANDKLLASFQRNQDMWLRNVQRLKSELKSEFSKIR